jgi:hypothetical protein
VRTGVFCVLLVAAVVVAAPAAHAAWELSPTLTDARAASPSVAVDDRDDVLVGWFEPYTGRIRVSLAPRGGGFGSPADVAVLVDRNWFTGLQVGLSPFGEAYALWGDRSGTHLWRSQDPDHPALLSEQRGSISPLLFDGDGNGLTTLNLHADSSGTSNVQWALSLPVTGPPRLEPLGPGNGLGSAAVNREGAAVVTGSASVGGSLWAAYRRAGGSFLPRQELGVTAIGATPAIDGAGRVTLTTSELRGPTERSRVFAMRGDASGFGAREPMPDGVPGTLLMADDDGTLVFQGLDDSLGRDRPQVHTVTVRDGVVVQEDRVPGYPSGQWAIDQAGDLLTLSSSASVVRGSFVRDRPAGSPMGPPEPVPTGTGLPSRPAVNRLGTAAIAWPAGDDPGLNVAVRGALRLPPPVAGPSVSTPDIVPVGRPVAVGVRCPDACTPHITAVVGLGTGGTRVRVSSVASRILHTAPSTALIDTASLRPRRRRAVRLRVTVAIEDRYGRTVTTERVVRVRARR